MLPRSTSILLVPLIFLAGGAMALVSPGGAAGGAVDAWAECEVGAVVADPVVVEAVDQGSVTSAVAEADAVTAEPEIEEAVAEPDVLATCPTPARAPSATLRRLPYLQQLRETSVRVLWTDLEETAGALEYWAPGSDEVHRVEAAPEEFSRRRIHRRVSFTQFVASVDGLEPGSTWCYRVVSGDRLVWDGGTFTTPAPGEPIRIVAFGDSGNSQPAQFALRGKLLARDVDLFLHVGDMAYAHGSWRDFERDFFDVYAALLDHVPVWPAIGNHEYITDEGAPYLSVFDLPVQALREEDTERYYSFDHGDLHVVSLDSNHFTVDRLGEWNDGDMADWLAQDLAAATPRWTIVILHHPPYSSGVHLAPDRVREYLVPLFEEYAVDLVIAGHDHHYERTVPMRGGVPAPDDPNAVTYIVAGGGGAHPRRARGRDFTAAVDDDTNNFLYLELDMDRLIGTAVDTDGKERDRFVIAR